jgi:hypothetical protein
MLLVDLLALVLERSLRKNRPSGNHLRSWYIVFCFRLILKLDNPKVDSTKRFSPLLTISFFDFVGVRGFVFDNLKFT